MRGKVNMIKFCQCTNGTKSIAPTYTVFEIKPYNQVYISFIKW